MDSFLKALIENGIGTGLAAIIAFLFYLVLKHILRQQDKIMDMAIQQNISWQKVIDEHTAQAREFHLTSTRAYDYIREEHKEMIENQKAINQSIKDNCAAIVAFRQHCEDIQKSCKDKQEEILEEVKHDK